MRKCSFGFFKAQRLRRVHINRLHATQLHDGKNGNIVTGEISRPMELVEYDSVKSTLLRNRDERLQLAKWVPSRFRAKKLSLVYSTEVHGRSLETLYYLSKGVSPTILVIQELSQGIIIGMEKNRI